MFNNKKILILGMARSGYEVAKLLSQYSNRILITDMKEQDEKNVAELISLGVEYKIIDTPEQLLDDTYDYVIKNPGIKKDNQCVLKARELNIEVINEVEAGHHLLPEDITIIAITGSNGKTTVTTIIYEILKKQGLPVHLGGNIGFPVSSLVNKVKPHDIIVLEISDHQLVDMYNFSADITILTNLSEAHIDFHSSYEIYKNTKGKIFNNQTKNDIAIINLENQDSLELTSDIKPKKMYFSTKQNSDIYLKDNIIYYLNEEIINISDIKLQGNHNYENVMCAIGALKLLNVNNDIIKDFLKTFGGVEHRIEFVKTINEIDYYNDSKSTNTEATITALQSFTRPTILLLGGLERNHTFEPLNKYLDNTKIIICYGETKNRIKEWADSINKECYIVDTLEQATLLAHSKSKPKDIVLLSPACASWDQFAKFENRGDEFKKVINSLDKE